MHCGSVMFRKVDDDDALPGVEGADAGRERGGSGGGGGAHRGVGGRRGVTKMGRVSWGGLNTHAHFMCRECAGNVPPSPWREAVDAVLARAGKTWWCALDETEKTEIRSVLDAMDGVRVRDAKRDAKRDATPWWLKRGWKLRAVEAYYRRVDGFLPLRTEVRYISRAPISEFDRPLHPTTTTVVILVLDGDTGELMGTRRRIVTRSAAREHDGEL